MNAETLRAPVRVTVLIPVLNRPERAEAVLTSLSSSEGDVRLDPVFLCSPADRREQNVIRSLGIEPRVVGWNPRGGDYAKKMNLGFHEATTKWVFLAADDLRFWQGWADEAVDVADRENACVIGTNDLGNQRTVRGDLSTHTLVHRDYGGCGTADEEGKILHEGYDHNFVDDEFVQTAVVRGTYAHAAKAIVEHLHPSWGKNRDDETYRKGMRRFYADRVHYNERRHLWGGEPR